MRLLSLDTSFSFINLTLIEDGKVVLHHYVDDGKKTLEHLPSLLKSLGVEPEHMDAFAVSLGVGYLTSLRIGITFMKTLAYLTKKPIVGYENLYMMCHFLKREGEFCVALKVSNQIFCRRCKDGKIGEIEVLKSLPESIKVVGLSGQGLGDISLEFFPFSLYGGLWAYKRLMEGYGGDNPVLLEPIYLRPPV
ncbi:MAG: tRNA threonylcarbamoyladenosine biosynthesis protein TsaB [Aquificota bacterium]|jgi:tRNA threonylcarbamoyl adenosine modification protein YeaZ|nr:tRNA threonylcarbamoyladenosine biosynthesis protein TsaB [Aquificaceae bacterium]MDM7266766.1 tRNA threonylcarbamoyladenosine biosynthesis protein TsaB [Aquificaceae bacterium]QWK13886.1 MAG: tRNA (adenosine(37)-N6)-threonylcarbamoyltransferase complex dimerization subunit type 1 TsaB [Aquificota bacterium]HAV40672.1 endopeptidase [Aquificaceae bacterium]HCO39405.1 endopeptidase [Aquificaceae bacterium]